MGCLNVHTERIGEGLKADVKRVGNGLEVSCGLVCSVGSNMKILWSNEYLSWLNSEIGVVKYNHLTATGDWSLAEVEIEELL